MLMGPLASSYEPLPFHVLPLSSVIFRFKVYSRRTGPNILGNFMSLHVNPDLLHEVEILTRGHKINLRDD